MPGQLVPILVYHHVYPEDAPELRPANFDTGAGIIGEDALRHHLQFVTDHGWQVMSTTRIVNWLTSGTDLPARALALHFDNGWLDTVNVTLPILRHFGMTATCYPITSGIAAASSGKSAAVRTLTEGTVEKPFMTWDHLQQLVDAGWEIGGHTHTHCKVADQHAAEGDEGVLREVQASHALFEKHLGFAPEHFAYPSGSRSSRTDGLLGSYYRSLRLWHCEFPVKWSFTDHDTSPLAIECQNIDRRVGFEDFTRIFAT